ncbi:hypothetical protein [Paraburkholderia kururiensis]|uniref:Transmembrane protein n=1 Tax=Paraburkholderia kururiensis TaxID=984307 RepID=A0ABZ0WLR0_9BURK|nr:hypothetical protein [Paraburkholderia kururiensis]WQD78307.1 hypothetical protein U0042_00900 [Paraburkholderia kururiensis]
MKPIAMGSIKPLRLVALAAVAAAVTHVVGLPTFTDAVLSVGTDMQLPLERMASDAPDAPEPARQAVRRHETPAPPTSTAQLTGSREVLRPRAAHRAPGSAPGYRQSITDSKYWT